MVQGHWTPYMGCEYGIQSQGKMGHQWTQKPYPIGSTYAGVVSRESLRIAFIYAALNGVEVCVVDIMNAYLKAPL